MSIAISKNSWHYKLHVRVRSLWGWDPSPDKKWSLCPYFHATVWGSLLTFFAIPIAVLGWLFCKVVRNIYKISCKIKLLNFIPEIIDQTIFVRIIDDAPRSFENHAISTGISWFFGGLFILLGISAAIFIVAAIFSLIFLIDLETIYAIPKIIANIFISIGVGIFYVAYGIGWFLTMMGDGLVIIYNWIINFVSNTENLYQFFEIAIIVIGSLFALWIASVASIMAISSKPAKKIFSWLTIKANGYMEAREKRIEENEEKEKLQEIPEKKTNNVKPKNNYKRKKSFVETLIRILASIIDKIKALYAVNIYEMVKGSNGEYHKEKTQILGPIGIIVKFIWSIKKGICPLLDFIDEEEIESKKQKSKASEKKA